MNRSRTDPLVLASEFSELRLELDPLSGAPRRLWSASAPEDGVDLACSVKIAAGGTEHRAPAGGLEYHGTVDVTLAADGVGKVAEQVTLTGRTFSVGSRTSRPEEWSLTWGYEFREAVPRLAISLEVHALTNDAIARNVDIILAPALVDRNLWRVHAPGNQLRTNLALTSLTRPTGISPAGGLRGSVGLVALDRTDKEMTLLIWPLSQTEIGDITLGPTSAGVSLHWRTDVAGQPGAGAPLSCSALHLDLLDRPFSDVLVAVPQCLSNLGITAPGTPPAWAHTANIYEVQIGFSVFAGDYRYSPYPEAQDLLADLDRIQQLGYNTLQIMPRQPYPSYNVHDYADITTSYGDEAVLRRLVAQCHSRGMKIILDILLHGVVDGEAIKQAIEAIRSGPFADRLDEATPDAFALDLSDDDSYLISWSRHLLDFEKYWIGGSPEHHPLIDEHPEWFCRDSADNITGVYTKAFDVAHPGWQRYFIDSALALVRRLDVDGFRFDAPTYNYFHNWSARTRTNAGVSVLGCLPLFNQLRTELRELKPDALLYTEPSGVLLRQAMDLNYNYDEQWLISAVMTGGADNEHGVRDAHELGQWLAARDATLPQGALTAHHIDSHDTFWWPLPGSKWRREQYGAAATAALMTVFALSGGPYMTFVGGEVDIEDHVLAVNRLRLERPEFVLGTSDYESVQTDDHRIYSVIRRSTTGCALLLVNLHDQATVATCVLGGPVIDSTDDQVGTPDAFGGESLSWRRQDDRWLATLTLDAFQAKAIPLDKGE